MIKRAFSFLNLLFLKRIYSPGNSRSRQKVISFVVAVLLLLILVSLAIQQYRWSGQVSEAEYERMHSSLLASMNQFRLHFNNELQQPGILLRPENAVVSRGDWKRYAEYSAELIGMPEYRMIQRMYLWIVDAPYDSRLLELNKEQKEYEPVSWPSQLLEIKEQYEKFFFRTTQMPPLPMRPFVAITSSQNLFLIQPLAIPRPSSISATLNEGFIGFLLIGFNSEIVMGELLPELVQNYFGSQDALIYKTAVISRSNPGVLLFRSEPGLTPEDFTAPDARLRLIDIRPERPAPDAMNQAVDGEPPPDPSFNSPFVQAFPPPLPPDLVANRKPGPAVPEGISWDLLAIHRKGSLESVVAAMRRRNLAVSFGGLLLLAASVALLFVSARRAQRLTQLQIDFVAGVSHELKTPLAVICSAGDNLADGVVPGSGDAMQSYGKLIRNEGRKLSAIVEQILQFAGVRAGRRRYSFQPVQINDVVIFALEQAHTVIDAAGFSVEMELSPDLPAVYVDPGAMSQILQNLFHNSIKYSNESRWIGVRTEKFKVKKGESVRIVVEDKGIGIDSKDISHILDPFYRGSAASIGQVHGTGLGLFFVKETLSAMGGDIRVESSPGKGSIFSIYLPEMPDSRSWRIDSTVRRAL
jgi:signal transduction histidine kinase